MSERAPVLDPRSADSPVARSEAEFADRDVQVALGTPTAALRQSAQARRSRRASAGLVSSVARRMVALQKSYGNQYVQRMIARERVTGQGTRPSLDSHQEPRDGGAITDARVRSTGLRIMRAPDSPDAETAPTTAKAAPPRADLVFLMGDPSAEAFFREAQRFYKQQLPKADLTTAGSLADILDRVKQSKSPIGRLVIVSHAHEDGTLQFKFDRSDPDNKLDFTELSEANQQGVLPKVEAKIIDDHTSIEIRGCNIGRSPLMLDQIDLAFGGAGKVTAPTHEQHYGHDTSGASRETFSGYFIEMPGKHKKPDSDLKTLFAAKYPFVPEKSWKGMLKKKTVINDKAGPFEQEVSQPAPADALTTFEPFLEAQLPASEGWSFKFVKRLKNGPGFDYTFEASRLDANGKPERQPVTIPFSPPSKQELENDARQALSRPDAYSYDTVKTVHDKQSGVLIFQLFAERTEWVIKHTEIRDASGPYEPPESETGWWGESSVTP